MKMITITEVFDDPTEPGEIDFDTLTQLLPVCRTDFNGTQPFGCILIQSLPCPDCGGMRLAHSALTLSLEEINRLNALSLEEDGLPLVSWEMWQHPHAVGDYWHLFEEFLTEMSLYELETASRADFDVAIHAFMSQGQWGN